MKLKLIFIPFLILLGVANGQAQFLKKLKERAKEKGLETREISYDSTAVNTNFSELPDEKEINTAEDFFTMDVVMKLYNEKGDWVQTSYFDKETFAMRIEAQVSPKPAYQDRKGKFYSYNEEAGRYESVSILPPSSMGFMMAGMIPQFYQLPQAPYLNAFKALADLDLAISFLVLEIAFIYEPSHFENDSNLYSKSTMACGEASCTKFSYQDPEYKDSYIVFDANGKLREFYIKTTKQQSSGDNKNQTGKFIFSYKPVSVELPDAVEQSLIPGPLGKILPIEKGLEPWKHNKKDKKKN